MLGEHVPHARTGQPVWHQQQGSTEQLVTSEISMQTSCSSNVLMTDLHNCGSVDVADVSIQWNIPLLS